MEYNSKDSSITIHDIDDISNIYKHNTLKEIVIYCPIRNEQDVIDLASYLKLNNKINFLKLAGCELEDSGIKYILEALKENKQIKNLCLCHNILDTEGSKLISDLIELNQTLEILQIYDEFQNSKYEDVVRNILKSMNKNKNIKKLIIKRMYVGESDELIEFVRNNTLIELDISECRISDNILEKFIDELRFNTSLYSLNASFCLNITKIMEKITNCLKVNQSLKSLIIGFNKIGDPGIKILSESLKINQTLNNLNLQNNNISDDGLIYLIEALKSNESIQIINLAGNRITDIGANYLITLFEKNKNLMEIILEKNYINKDKLEEVNKLCKNNSSEEIL